MFYKYYSIFLISVPVGKKTISFSVINYIPTNISSKHLFLKFLKFFKKYFIFEIISHKNIIKGQVKKDLNLIADFLPFFTPSLSLLLSLKINIYKLKKTHIAVSLVYLATSYYTTRFTNLYYHSLKFRKSNLFGDILTLKRFQISTISS